MVRSEKKFLPKIFVVIAIIYPAQFTNPLHPTLIFKFKKLNNHNLSAFIPLNSDYRATFSFISSSASKPSIEPSISNINSRKSPPTPIFSQILNLASRTHQPIFRTSRSIRNILKPLQASPTPPPSPQIFQVTRDSKNPTLVHESIIQHIPTNRPQSVLLKEFITVGKKLFQSPSVFPRSNPTSYYIFTQFNSHPTTPAHKFTSQLFIIQQRHFKPVTVFYITRSRCVRILKSQQASSFKHDAKFSHVRPTENSTLLRARPSNRTSAIQLSIISTNG